MVSSLPDFKYENSFWNLPAQAGKGYKIVAGCDEVGRGCFAGPVVAACVIFEPNKISLSSRLRSQKDEISGLVQINDSKKLKPRQRERADIWIKENALAWGIGSATVNEINKLGIKKATEMAFRRAIKNCKLEINYLLVDAFYLPYIKGLRRKNQKAIIKGDAKSTSIAAASIIAKVARDKIMLTLSKHPKYQNYGWGRNKGYGTREHQNAIKEFGTTNLHRTLFVETFLSK